MMKVLVVLALTAVARAAEGGRRLAVESGEEACEGKGLTKSECKHLGCAWGEGECWSAISDKQRELMEKKKKAKKDKKAKKAKKDKKKPKKAKKNKKPKKPKEPEPVAPKVTVITDAAFSNDGSIVGTFWNLWRDGARAAGADLDFLGLNDPTTGVVDSAAYAAAIESACETADAMVAAVYAASSSPDYAVIDAALNACLDQRPDLPIFSTAYDTYQNGRLYGYVGPENFAMGQKCGRALLFTNDPANLDAESAANKNAVSGRGEKLAEAVASAEVRCPNKECQIYWPVVLSGNAAVQGLVAGITSQLEEYGFTASIIRPSLEDELSLLDQETGQLNWMKVISGNVTIWQDFKDISNGFTVLVSSLGTEFFPVHAKLVCGTVDLDEDGWQIGASPFREGLTATSNAAAAARLVASGEPWRAVKGNNEAAAILESIMSASTPYIAQISRDQKNGVNGLGYAAHEPYMRLGVQVSTISYGDGRVGGGSVLDLFDSVCWEEGFEATYGRPVGVVKQFYHEGGGSKLDLFDEGGDNLAYIAQFKEVASGDDIITVNFRGTQGGTALQNWLVNLDFDKQNFPCPNFPTGLTCKVHKGFRSSYDGLVVVGLLTQLKSLIADVTAASGKYPKVMVTGHSLGGAMATVAAYDFALVHGITVFGLYTQGSPRVFETRTRNYLESIRTFPVWRSTFGEDPVPRIPFDAMNFQHIGVEIHGMGIYKNDGTGILLNQLEGDGSGEDADTEAAKGLFSTSIGDHGLGPGNYLMHGGAYLVSTTASPCTAGKNVPKDYGYDSCEAKCAAKTGASGNKILGNGPACWLFGSSSDCDTQCPSGYCSYAHVRFTVAPAASLASRVPLSAERAPPPSQDYPGGWFDIPCLGSGGRSCCCDAVQTGEAKYR